MSNNTEVMEVKAEVVPTNNMPQAIDISGLLEKVIEKGPEAIKMLDGLLALQDKQQQRIALAEFNKAKATCQSELPSITKTRKVWNKGRTAVTYKYASLDDARRQCMPVVCKNGFADGWKTENKDKGILITYTVRHDLGHEESTSMFCPMEQSNYMNSIQRSGSTITYGKRYTFCDFWGIVLDEDDDGRGNSEKGNQTPQQRPRQQSKPVPEIDQAERDRRAIIFIDKMVADFGDDIEWNKVETTIKMQNWSNEKDMEYIERLKKNSKDKFEADLPY